MLFSKENSTGKTTSLLILGNLDSSNSKMDWQVGTEQRQGQRCMLKLYRYCQTLELSYKRD